MTVTTTYVSDSVSWILGEDCGTANHSRTVKAVCCDFLNVTDTNTGKNTLVQFNDINATGDLGPDQLDLTYVLLLHLLQQS